MSAGILSRRRAPALAATLAVVIVLAVLPAGASPFALRVLQSIFFGAGLALAWNMLGGFAGYWSFGQAAFLGLGAFVCALLQEHAGLPPALVLPVGLLAGGGAAALFALVFGYPLLRLRGTYFAIAMLGVSLMLGELSSNVDMFEGALGIVLAPVNGDIAPEVFFYYVFLVLAVLCLALSAIVRYSRLGYGLIAIREDEDTARMMGIPTEPYKVITFTLSALVTGLIGAAYALSLGYITTSTVFRPDLSLDMIVNSLLGGMGTLVGPVLGAAVMTVLTQVVLGDLLQVHMLVIGLIIIALVFLLPNGIMGGLANLRLGRRRPAAAPAEPAADAAAGLQPAPAAQRQAYVAREGEAPALELVDITMQFRGLKAIDGVSIRVPAGSISTIIGPNGAGKSTIFNMITGYLTPTSGTIRYGGAPIDGIPTHLLSRRGIARAFQISKPFHGLTVFENVLVAALFGAEGPRDPQAVTRDALAVTGLSGLAGERAAALPVGHLRKLELARVIAARPRLVLADEPCAGLNATESQDVVAILEVLRARGATVLLVEHDMKTVMQASDHIFVVAAGRAIADGIASEVVHDPKVIEAYLGRPLDHATGPAAPPGEVE